MYRCNTSFARTFYHVTSPTTWAFFTIGGGSLCVESRAKCDGTSSLVSHEWKPRILVGRILPFNHSPHPAAANAPSILSIARPLFIHNSLPPCLVMGNVNTGTGATACKSPRSLKCGGPRLLPSLFRPCSLPIQFNTRDTDSLFSRLDPSIRLLTYRHKAPHSLSHSLVPHVATARMSAMNGFSPTMDSVTCLLPRCCLLPMA